MYGSDIELFKSHARLCYSGNDSGYWLIPSLALSASGRLRRTKVVCTSRAHRLANLSFAGKRSYACLKYTPHVRLCSFGLRLLFVQVFLFFELLVSVNIISFSCMHIFFCRCCLSLETVFDFSVVFLTRASYLMILFQALSRPMVRPWWENRWLLRVQPLWDSKARGSGKINLSCYAGQCTDSWQIH